MTEPGIRDRIVSLERVKASELVPNVENWRSHPPEQRTALSGVLDEIGMAGALIARRTDDGKLVLLDGHLRRDLLPDEIVPVLVTDLTEDEGRLLLATYDPLGALAGRDTDALRALLGRVADGDDTRDLLARLHNEKFLPTRTLLGDPDDVPEVPVEPVTRVGDLWFCGEHRVLCGDATSAADVERVMGGGTADLLLTDPPYGVAYVYDQYEDSRENLHKLIERFAGVLETAAALALITCGNSYQYAWPTPSWTLAWCEPAGVGCGPWGFTCWQPILAYGKDPYLAVGLGSRPDTYIGTGQGASSDEHPVAKPVKVWTWLMERGSTAEDESVLDPFCGSGTTVVVAETLRRRARGIELSPAYVDVTCLRYASLTGSQPTLEATGQTFEEVAQDRLATKAKG